jgi:calcium and integrin-binding protein 1
MGQQNSQFSREELDEYADLVYLTRSEILRLFDKFSRIDPIRVGQNRNAKISGDRIVAATEELRLNPFGDRICQVQFLRRNGLFTQQIVL